MSAKAVHIHTRDQFRAERVAGSFYIDAFDVSKIEFWYTCPCGCERQAPLRVGINCKPDGSIDGRSTWNWNGSVEAPTLTPSVDHRGHWHGWLTDGEWKHC